MSPNIANDLLYILSILESIGKLSEYTKGYSDAEEFFEVVNQMPFNASLSLLVNIGEASGKMSKELREKHVNIPWKTMKNFRNRVAYDYVNLNIFIISDVIKDKLPSILENLEDIVSVELNNKKFILEEYQDAYRQQVL
ncbi:HepT-like ribonuclease domain-containing protein [Ilyobacter polytropus]|uniref:DUF86 domain-containing protein n=1 Tax=Ilyobacter polytropus (strain ATCC 51220 / DSM 2926 / LMG 16218 / CuHBu1) TaxID=572544 RepID=E3HDV4_ILYPC|nr:HepT-like ribonuclease domain-containing protein [Ilyobacter polytropus]ADO84566.1 protein of unknown function DUF86 [Ilyobacter polytropus DSM 2926]